MLKTNMLLSCQEMCEIRTVQGFIRNGDDRLHQSVTLMPALEAAVVCLEVCVTLWYRF